jgi:hypothetical protein
MNTVRVNYVSDTVLFSDVGTRTAGMKTGIQKTKLKK